MTPSTPSSIQLQQALYKACYQNDLARLSSLITQINNENEVYYLLRYLGKECPIEVAQYLFQYAQTFHTENIDKDNEKIIEIFKFFLSWERLDIIKLFVNFGYDINNDNENYNYNAFAQAAYYGYLEIAHYLVELGVDIYACNHFALKNAIHKDNQDFIFYLYELYNDKDFVKKTIIDIGLSNFEKVLSSIDKIELYGDLDKQLKFSYNENKKIKI